MLVRDPSLQSTPSLAVALIRHLHSFILNLPLYLLNDSLNLMYSAINPSISNQIGINAAKNDFNIMVDQHITQVECNFDKQKGQI